MIIEYDYFKITAFYKDAMQETFYLKIPVWQMSPNKENWEVEKISKEFYESINHDNIK